MENLLDTIINDFDPEKFIHFFRQRNSKFRPLIENTSYLDDENFSNSLKLGEIPFDEVTKLVIYAFQVKNPLSERSGKKAQYEKGKKILKDEQADAGMFIFYDENGSFRFSLIYAEYFGTKRSFNNFKRFTYFVSKDQTNKTFKKQIGEGDFSNLDKIKTAFSVEKVTKEFYQEIANWYFWAMDQVWFPEDYKYSENPEKDREIRIATNLIRLITRIIFIWFIKQKGLVPDKLFGKDILKKIVKDFGNSTNYYNAILQNLFFATLNQRKEQRGFANDGDFVENRTHFGIKTLYRYKDLFNIPDEEVLKLFEDVPFLNGGLFDCLDKDGVYIDGFSRNPKKRAKISDTLFFQEDIINVDLSKYEMGKNKPVRGLIEILKSYNFTIDESTPVDQEVALDPELLGKIFENLLASYNPETATTARKATGSYYTPREIVDYMVDESLKAYLKVTEASRFAKVAKASPLCNEVTESSCFAYPFLNPNQDLKVHYGKKGTLPHWQQGDVWYFVTFRLADSLPAEKVEELKAKREAWLKQHGGSLDNLNEQEREEYYKLFSDKVEEWLNAGYGSCILKDYEIAKIVKDTLCYFDGKRYILDEWVIMPNHVHVLVKPIDNNGISDILHSWKSYSAKQILKVIEASCFADKVNEASRFAKVTKASSLCPSSHQVWLHESYDHIVRNENAFNAIRKYIRENPEKANITILDICCSWKLNNEFTNQDGSDTLRSEDASITQLLSYSDDVPPLTEEEKIAIVKAISEIKILDPACGSGAFPMGILHKLLLVLQKVDPENTLWYKLQREKVLKEIDDVLNNEDSKERDELLSEINDAFDTKINHPDYARKLFLIENCIYGVDIQPIAIQISKLRFFISLIIDQNVDKTKDSFGITPLPNLETKFVCANTLIGIEKPKQLSLIGNEIKHLEEQIKTIRHRYFQAKKRTQKLNLQKKDKELRDKLAEELEKNGFSTTASKKITNFDPYDQNSSADWFDPEWMFGVTDGFDIVIGNPPYIDSETMINIGLENLRNYLASNLKFTKGNWDIYIAFFEIGFNLLNQSGIITFITPDKWISKRFGYEMRKNLLCNYCIITESGRNVFESSNIDSIITFITKQKNDIISINKFIDKKIIKICDVSKNSITEPFTFDWLFSKNIKILNKIESLNSNLTDFGICESACATSDAYKLKNFIFNISESLFSVDNFLKVINTGTIGKYVDKWGKVEMTYLGNKYLFPAVNRNNFLKEFTNTYGAKSVKQKLIIKGLTLLDACFDPNGNIIPGKSTLIVTSGREHNLKFLLALLNSKLPIFYIKEKYSSSSYNKGINFNKEMINNLPIPIIPESTLQPFIDLVDKILLITKDEDYLSNPDKQAKIKEYERQIDEMVYKLYGLTEEEIRVIENGR